MLMNKPKKTKAKSNADKKRTPTPVISGYTEDEMEENILIRTIKKLEKKPSLELADEPRMDFRIGDRAVSTY